MEWYNVKEKQPTDLRHYYCLVDGKNLTVAFYTKGHEVEFEDYDSDEEYDDFEEKNGTLYLKEGWYELCEQRNGVYDEVYFKRNVSHWMLTPDLPNN